MKFNYRVGTELFDIALEKVAGGYQAVVDGETYQVEVVRVQDGEIQLRVNGSQIGVDWAERNGKLWVGINGMTYTFEKASAGKRVGSSGSDGGNLVSAPMPGRVRAVFVTEGEQVERGQTLLLLEAMKMEMRILAPRAGRVIKLKVEAGQQVGKGDVLVAVE
ncbi:MAG: biotin/lipoyl-binding protein [Chloroflexi bacterium]|nr:biotin/lipoyl-binding protein [Chloroflexota bacterium]